MSFSPAWLDELRSRTLLSALIGKSIKVTRAGREWKACCPFHHEKTPSFTINDEKGFYHCFGCSAHGDAIRWMTDQRGLSFIDAVKELAAAAGMEVPAMDRQSAAKAERQATLRDVTIAADDWFQKQLLAPGAASIRAYCDQRGLTADTCRAFGIGYAPDSRSALKAALSSFPTPMLIDAGMLISVDDKEPYDRFRGRLMIPIRDTRGRTIAFGGRIMGDGEPKYLNSPDTPLFDKGRTLYNLDKAAPVARRTNRLIVVEGYMDAIALVQAGLEEVVAPLGTALTEHQLALLWRYAPVPVLCFDGDAAGQRAANRAANRALPLLQPGQSLAVAILPLGIDPDDMVRQQGRDAFVGLLEQAEPLATYLWRTTVERGDTNTPEGRAAIKKALMQLTDDIRDRDVADQYRHFFQERFDGLFMRRASNQSMGVKQARQPQSRFRGFRPPEPPPSATAQAIGGNSIDDAIIGAIIGGLLRFPDRIIPNVEPLDRLSAASRSYGALLSRMIDTASAKETLETEQLLSLLESNSVYNSAVALLRADRMAFSFNQEPSDGAGRDGAQARADMARKDLDAAILALTSWQDWESAFNAAMARYSQDLSSESEAELIRLRQQRHLLAERLEALRNVASGPI